MNEINPYELCSHGTSAHIVYEEKVITTLHVANVAQRVEYVFTWIGPKES